MAGGDISTLWDLVVKPCDPLTQGVVAYYDIDLCKWTTKEIPNLDAYDCDFVEACMQTTIDTINNTLISIGGTVASHTASIANLNGAAHFHSNYGLLQTLSNTGGGDMFLSNDGTYKGLATTSYYQTVKTNGLSAPQRTYLNFGAGFSVSDNPVTGSTDIVLTTASCNDLCATIMACAGIQSIEDSIIDYGIRIAILEASTDGIKTCTDVTDCMTATVLGLQNQIDQTNTDLNSLDDRQTVLEGEILNHEGRISALEAGSGGGGLDCVAVASCPVILGIQGSISALDTATDNAYVASSWNAGTHTITFTEKDGGTQNLVITGLISEQTFTCASVLTRTCAHNLNAHPTAVCVDGSGNMVVPAGVIYSDANTIVVSFNIPFTGQVFLR